MTPWELLVHQDLSDQLETWDHLRRKVDWTMVQLAATGGSSTIVKGHTGSEISWRRTPVEGNHFYLWWVPVGVSGTESSAGNGQDRTILVRGVLHHDDEADSLGHDDDYEPLDVSALDPRYEDQRAVAAPPFDNVDVRVVVGSPGSGKTVALLFSAINSIARWPLAGSSDQKSVLYVTYTRGLAEQAENYFGTYGVDDKVEALTFDQLLARIIGARSEASAHRRDQAAKAAFMKWLGHQPDHTVGPWRDYPGLLWGELRSYLLGMALPIEWQRQGLRQMPASGRVLSLADYLDIRSQSLRDHTGPIDNEALETAHRLAENAIEEEAFFEEQCRARSAVLALSEGKRETAWLDSFNTIAIDEIQDLTLLQISAIVETARLAASGEREVPLLFVAAGDESQIVQPSGFDWGQTKDLFSQRLLQHPRDFPLRNQRRSPRRLAQLITDSWGLYSSLPKGLYPKAEARSADSDSDEDGVLLRWRTNGDPDWQLAFDELQKHPDAAVVDLNSAGSDLTAQLPETQRTLARSQVYEPRQIKGLERKIVLVHGLGTALDHVRDLSAEYERTREPLPALAARNRIDNARVALSRSTHMMVLLERESQDIGERLALEDAEIVDWETLRQRLQEADQDLTAFDRIHTHLRTAEESFRHDDYGRAEQQIQQAEQLLGEVADEHLAARVREQKAEIEKALARQEVEEDLDNAEGLCEAGKPVEAYEAWLRARQLSRRAADPSLAREVSEFWEDRDRDLDTIANESWQKAREYEKNGKWTEAGEAYETAAEVRRHQGNQRGEEAIQCLADRYKLVPPTVEDQEQTRELVSLIARYVECVEATETTQHRHAQRPLKEWLEETEDSVAGDPTLCLEWARAAAQLAAWRNSDLIDDYPGFDSKAVEASAELRRLGESSSAAELLDLAKEDIPEDLATLEDLLQLLEYGDWKTAIQDWYPEERAEVAKRLKSAAALLISE